MLRCKACFALPPFVWALLGCNFLFHGQAGPVVGTSAADVPEGSEAQATGKIVVGGEASGTVDIDMAAGAEWSTGRPQPDHASRLGPSQSVYLRGSNDGVALGMRPGVFVAGTNTEWMGRVGGALDVGLASFDGRPYGAVGFTGSLGGGFTVDKSYDDRALILCRNMTYLTLTAQVSYQRIPDGPSDRGVDMVSGALLFGVTSFSDGGAPSDAANATTRCPR
jgi:hypothetical protein